MHAVLQVRVVGVALWAQLLPALGSYLFSSGHLRSTAAVLAVFIPPLAALAWHFMRAEPTPEHGNDSGGNGSGAVAAIAEGASAAVAHYNITAGIGLTLWALALIQLVNEASTVGRTLAQLLRDPAISAGCVANAILAVDAAGLWVALLGFAAAEDGFAAAAWVAAGSAVVGPGAAVALYLGNVRERRIGKAVVQSQRKLE